MNAKNIVQLISCDLKDIYIYIYSKSVKVSECNSSWIAESEV